MWQSRTLFLYLNISAILLSKTGAVSRSLQMKKLERNATFDDNTCLSRDLLFSTGVWSLPRCALMCSEDDACQTMFYNKNEGKCHGCTVHYTTGSLPLSSAGFMHFYKEQQSCEAGWSTFQGSCYSLSQIVPFEDGASYCEANGAHPVFIETAEENEYMKIFLATDPTTIWYIGITDSVKNKEFKYYGTNLMAEFLNFAVEPDDATNNLHCVIIVGAHVNYQWLDFDCNMPLPTICEKMP